MTDFLWSDDRVDMLKKLWGAGLSASQIAAELCGPTRNAVIGKVHRLGLSGRVKAARSGPPRKARPAPMVRIAKPVSRGNTALAQTFECEEVVSSQEPAADNVVPLSQRCTLFELNDQKCSWPIGDPATEEFFFCGGKRLSGMLSKDTPIPYCATHHRLAYQPATQWRGRRYNKPAYREARPRFAA